MSIHCNQCDFNLKHADGKCPECETPFSLDDPESYYRLPDQEIKGFNYYLLVACAVLPFLILAYWFIEFCLYFFGV